MKIIILHKSQIYSFLSEFMELKKPFQDGSFMIQISMYALCCPCVLFLSDLIYSIVFLPIKK